MRRGRVELEESASADVVRLSENNSADTIDAFATANIRSWAWLPVPSNINYERGGTRWETAMSAFVYLLPEGYARLFHTEIDVTFTDSGRIYSAGH